MPMSEIESAVRPWDTQRNSQADTMSHSLIGADRTTHLKIVAVALAGAIVVILIGVTARVTDIGIAGAQNVIVKAGKPAAYTARHTTVR
jgi:uracil DNA glycosylase